ncbi:hypothetical protein AB0J81_25940 [Streptomyces bobili]|uniref:hypothetical protein n=1 Tax=Streptomyces bobili TaxID=67280 RepID=UPI003428FF49
MTEGVARTGVVGVPANGDGPVVYVTSTPAGVWEAAPGEEPAQKIDAVPGNHSPSFAPDLSVVVPGGRTLVSAALSRLACGGATV